MNQFATSDTVSVKASDNSGSSTAVLEAYEPSTKLLSGKKDEKTQQTDALVQTGVLPAMPIDGLLSDAGVTARKEPTTAWERTSSDATKPPSSSEVTMANISDETKQHGKELAELIISGTNGGKVMDLVKQSLAKGDLQGLILAANVELAKSENPSHISYSLSKAYTNLDAKDASISPAKSDKYTSRAGISVFSAGANTPMLTFSVTYNPEN